MTSESDEETFLYFAYGSNLSKARIHINNPSAVFFSIAKLQDYKLQFGRRSTDICDYMWHGGVANIHEAPGHHVWGAIWKICTRDMKSLDRQEERYRPIEVCVSIQSDPATSLNDSDTMEYKCRTYEMLECIPDLSSPQYKNVILKGAAEVGLPQDYMKFLQAVEHNGYDGHVEICDKL